ERAAGPGLALDRDPPAVALHDPPRDGEAQPGALVMMGGIGDGELVEEARQELGGDPAATVSDREAGASVAPQDLADDARVPGAESDRIVEERAYRGRHEGARREHGHRVESATVGRPAVAGGHFS